MTEPARLVTALVRHFSYFPCLPGEIRGLAALELAVAKTFGFSCFGFLVSLLPRVLLPLDISMTSSVCREPGQPDGWGLWRRGARRGRVDTPGVPFHAAHMRTRPGDNKMPTIRKRWAPLPFQAVPVAGALTVSACAGSRKLIRAGSWSTAASRRGFMTRNQTGGTSIMQNRPGMPAGSSGVSSM